jgi:hypothetical protein
MSGTPFRPRSATFGGAAVARSPRMAAKTGPSRQPHLSVDERASPTRLAVLPFGDQFALADCSPERMHLAGPPL